MVVDFSIPYDMSELKRIDGWRNPEIWLRCVIVVLAYLVLVEGIGLEATPIILWAVCYSAMQVIMCTVVAVMPQRVGLLGLSLVVFAFTLEALAYYALPIWLWHHDEELVRLLGLLFVFGAMLESASFRLSDFLRRWLDAFFVLLAVVVMSMTYPVEEPSMLSGYLLLGFLILFGYYVFAIIDILRGMRRLQAATRREVETARLSAIGQVTGGVAHDFNNLLTVILGNLDLRRHVPTEAEKERLIGEVEAAAQRAGAVTEQLLAYARRSNLDPQPVDPVEVLHESAFLIERAVPASVQLTFDVPNEPLPLTRVDRAQLGSVLLNLVLNARDATDDQGEIIITTDAIEVTRQAIDFSSPLTPGRYIRFCVRDNGVGIPKDALAQVTSPFYTTKPVGKGSGLGLSMAKGFAEQSGGALVIESNVRHGTIVHIYLPVVPNEYA